MKINLYLNALSPHNLDLVKQALEKQLAENHGQIKTVATDAEAAKLFQVNADLIGAIYLIERHQNK